MAVATTQMNVRIPAEVKTAGDRAFASEGLTPTEVVRCVWEKAASRGRGLQEVLDLVRGKPGESVALNLFESASCDVTFQMRGLGVDLSAADAPHPSDDELLEMAYYEKAVQRGLL